jgi:pre-mRNA-splicing factor 38A
MSLISNPNFKYVTVLGATYFRLTGKTKEIYPILEGLYSDYRKIRVRDSLGNFKISHIDEIMEELLTKEIVFDIVLPR